MDQAFNEHHRMLLHAAAAAAAAAAQRGACIASGSAPHHQQPILNLTSSSIHRPFEDTSAVSAPPPTLHHGGQSSIHARRPSAIASRCQATLQYPDVNSTAGSMTPVFGTGICSDTVPGARHRHRRSDGSDSPMVEVAALGEYEDDGDARRRSDIVFGQTTQSWPPLMMSASHMSASQDVGGLIGGGRIGSSSSRSSSVGSDISGDGSELPMGIYNKESPNDVSPSDGRKRKRHSFLC